MSPAYYLVVSLLLFLIGLGGVVSRKNFFFILMGIELMLSASNLAFATFSKMHNTESGQAYILFIMALAAAEACVGLAIIYRLFKLKSTIAVDMFKELKG